MENFYSDQVDANITPLHRKLTNRNFQTDFFTETQINKENFFSLIDKIQSNVSKYFNEFYTKRSSTVLFKLYNEFLHFMNVVVKYHLNDRNFVEKLVTSIYNFLKQLFNNQQQGKIYMLKKQILKLLTKLALKMNDEKFFQFIDIEKKNNYFNELEDYKFCFENTEINNMIFKIFLMINHKTYSSECLDKVLKEKVEFFLNLMMIKNDGFSNNLDNISKNKKFLIDFDKEKFQVKQITDQFQKEIQEKISNLFIILEGSMVKMYKNTISEADYINQVQNSFKDINEILSIFIEQNKNKVQNINNLQYNLFMSGYYTKLIHILTNISQITKLIPIHILKKNYETFFQNILLFIHENPFLALLFVTHKFCKVLFHNEPEYNLAIFKLYNKIFKLLNKFNYRIDPRPFFDNFKIHFNKENIFNLEVHEMYEELYNVASIYDNIISITNKNIKNIIYQLVSEEIKDIFVLDMYYKNLKKIEGKLQENSDVKSITEKEKHLLWSYKNLLRILNHMSDGHFIATTSQLNSDITIQLVEELLKIKLIHPNLRRSLIGFYTKYKIELPFKIFKSSDFNEEVFNGMTEKIPYMTKEGENIFSFGNQKNELQVIIDELFNYPENIIKHEDYFRLHATSFFKYFSEVVFLPVFNCMYKVAYFNEKINSELKYAVYKILVLFCKCFYFFLKNIELFEFYDQNLFFDYLCIDICSSLHRKNEGQRNQNESVRSILERECEKIKSKLEADLKELDEENFLIKDNIIFEKFIFYKKYYFLKNKIYLQEDLEEDESECENLQKKDKEKNAPSSSNNVNNGQMLYMNIENSDRNNNYSNRNKIDIPKHNDDLKNNLDHKHSTDYMKRIECFLEDFTNRKNGENEDLIYHRIFADEKTYKEKFSKPNVMIDFKLRGDFKKSFFLLLFDRIIDYEKKCENLSYEYLENTQNPLENLVKIFKIDPDFCQNILLEDKNKDNSRLLLEDMIRKNLTCMFQIVFVEFNVINCNEGKSTYKNILNILEFIRLHCENHNRIFQTYLCYFDILNKNENEEKFYLINFILKIFKLIYDFVNFKLKKKEILQFFGLKEIHFFDDMLGKIVEFLVEVYQGNFEKNFDFLVNGDYDFSIFLEIFLKTFDDIINVVELEIIVMNFMTFYLSLLEDYDMSDANKNSITKKLNLKLISQTINYCAKKCKMIFVDADKNLSANGNTNNTLYSTVPENTADELLEIYKINKNDFSEFHLFKLMTKCYILLRILADLNNSKAIDILENHKEVYNNIDNLKTNKGDRNYAYNIQKFEVYKLLSSLVKNVEINFTKTKANSVSEEIYLKEVIDSKILNSIDELENENSEKNNGEEESVLKPVNFLIHNESLFLNGEDLKVFQDKIPIDNYNSKLYDLVSNIPDIVSTLKFKKRLYSYNSKFILFLSSMNYKIFEYISIFLVFIVNIMMQWTMTYDKITTKNSNFYDTIINISIANIIFLGIVISNYMFFKLLAIEKKSGGGFFSFMGNFLNDEIFFLLWNMIIGIVAVSSPICNFLFSLQLFSIISFFDTMKTILMTIKLRWKQFTSTAILIVILIIFFTGISFYFIRDYYLLQDIDLNVCSNYIYCFLTIFSYGVRSGGGIGDVIGLVRYDDPKFWFLFFFQWIFYFSIVLIMLNVINGIIVDTFQDLREKNNLRNDIRNNECYVCGKNRIDFQINSLDFEAHKHDDHNLHNYIYYLIKINETDEQDLNSVDYQSLMCCRKKQTSFFPMKKCISLMHKEK